MGALASGSRNPPPMKAMETRNREKHVGGGGDGKEMARSWRSPVPRRVLRIVAQDGETLEHEVDSDEE